MWIFVVVGIEVLVAGAIRLLLVLLDGFLLGLHLDPENEDHMFLLNVG
jgi:hypothetical protein